MTTRLIAPGYLHDLLSKDLLKDKQVVFNYSLLPLNSFVEEIVGKIDNNYDQSLKERLSNLESELSILKAYVNNQTFIQSIKDFHIDMYLYAIKIEDLADQSRKDQDLKAIYQAISDLKPNEIEAYEKLQDYLLNNDLENTYLVEHNYQSNLDLEIINLLYQHQLKDYKQDLYDFKSLTINYANNIRSEIEASAQFIIENKLAQAQVVYLNAEYLPIIKQIYQRYNIKSNLDYYNDSRYNKRFLSLVKLLINQDHEALVGFISANLLNLKYTAALEKLVDFFNFDLNGLLNFEVIELNDPILNRHDIKHYNELIENSKENIAIIKDFIAALNIRDYSNGQVILEDTFNYLLENMYDKQLNKISNKILAKHSEISSANNLLESLEEILIDEVDKSYDDSHIFVTSISEHLHFNKEHVILLGATSKNYPNLKSLSGVIDETYVKNLNYPKKSFRFERQLASYQALLNAANLHIFYPLASNEGKNIEPSFSLLNYGSSKGVSAQAYKLVENDYFIKKQRALEPCVAKALFFDNDKLYGSISSFESYNSCPYSYFLKVGLKMYPKSLPELSPAYIGSLLHDLIEKIVAKRIKDRADILEADVLELIEQSFQALAILNDPRVKIVKETLAKHFLVVLKRLNRIDDETNFEPLKVEHEFNYQISDKISINGKIDRIDQYQDYLRVIDYKSSNHMMSEASFKSGLQLQLMTYLLAASETMNLVPAGAYYISLNENFKMVTPRKVKKSKPFFEKYTNEDYLREVQIANRQHGWHFEESDDMYLNVTNSVNLKVKDDMVVISKILNFETVVTILKDLYEEVYNNLASGIIEAKPVKNGCLYCDFKNICQNHHASFTRQPLYSQQKLTEEIE